jgi:ParB/RepB/Spo0J family partition protein
MTTKTEPKTEAVDTDAIYFLPRNTIHPDPDQPRVKADADLQASIDSEGIIQAITVRPHPTIENEWMIADGERRWLGGAHLKTIPCRIRLDLEDAVDRLITQLSANTGKPLSPIEQARAFKKALDADPKLSQAKLAERLGIPRTTIGDRIRLIDLDAAWLDLISAGKLQVSHAAILSTFAPVPSEYQKKAAKNFVEDYRVKRYIDNGGTVPVDDMSRLLYVSFRDYIKPTSKAPGYRGPILRIKNQYSPGKTTYAADIKIWRPLFNKYENTRRKNAGPSFSRSGYVDHTPIERAMKVLKSAGIEVPAKPVGKTAVKPADGEAVFLTEDGWAKDIHPSVLLEKIDPRSIVFVQNFGGDELWTTDSASITASREAFRQHAEDATATELKQLRAGLTTRAINNNAISGPGASPLLKAIAAGGRTAKVVALAIGVPAPFDAGSLGSENAEKLLSALAAVSNLNLPVPLEWQIEERIASVRKAVAFKLPEPPKSKKQQKREARAAGKQVGDPERAKDVVLEDPEREFVEADLEFEEANA